MAIKGKLEVVLKFGEMPTEVEVDKNGWKSFGVECGGKEVKVRMRPKNWTKLEAGAKQWAQWVAAVGGALEVVEGGLSMPEANVQVFERKLKAAGEGAAPAAPEAPAAGEEPKAS